ncbi:MAG: thiamine-phosphate kinase [Thermoplasmata archaeon]|nr:thiamine-phosphate kinase [Thermoplasmata archaeon]
MSLRRPVRAGNFSERGFHAWAKRHLPAGRTGLLPLGDDTAAVPVGGVSALLTTDALVEGTHFLARSPPDAVGAAAAAASLSDIAAKGGSPLALLLDLLIPPSTPDRWPQRVALGAERMMARFGGHLVGGDIKSASQRCVVGTVLGTADPRHLAPRTAAVPGDVLLTTGAVGRGGIAGLALRRGHAPTVAELRQLLRIQPRVQEGQTLASYARAMLDTSDGLAEAAHLLAEASHVGVVLDEGQIPWAPGLSRRVPDADRRRSVGFFGGDYELLAAVPSRMLDRALSSLDSTGTAVTPVGEVTAGRGVQLRVGRHLSALPRSGWDPFHRAAL